MSNSEMPTPPDFLQNWNQEEELLSFFLGGDGSGGTGLTPPMPAFSPDQSGQVPKAAYPGPPMHTIKEQTATAAPQAAPQQQPKPESFNEAVQRAGFASRSERSRRKSSKAAAADEGDYGQDDDAGGYQKTPMMNHYGGGPSGRGRSGSGMGGGRSSSMSSTSSMTKEEHLAWLNKINLQIQQGQHNIPTPPTFMDGMPVLNADQMIDRYGAMAAPGGGGGATMYAPSSGMAIHHGGMHGGLATQPMHIPPPYYGAPLSSSHPAQGMYGGAVGGYSHSPPFHTGSAPAYMSGGGGGQPHQGSPPDQVGGPAPTADERRARRLARNRESARQSRRRKKEYLALLSEKVSTLNDEMDTLRTEHIKKCIPSLKEVEDGYVKALAGAKTKEAIQNILRDLWDNTSPNCEEMKEATGFSWRVASNTLLPNYRKFLIWLGNQNDLFFKKKKTEKNERVSSKQLGERLTNDGKGGTCDNMELFWALFCYDMSFSYDQEERLVTALKQKVNPAHSSKLRAAEMLVDAAGDAVKTVMDIADKGLEEALFDILTAQQAAKFMAYVSENSERISKAFGSAAQVEDSEKQEVFADLEKALAEVSLSDHNKEEEAGVIIEVAEAETVIMKNLLKRVVEVLPAGGYEEDQQV